MVKATGRRPDYDPELAPLVSSVAAHLATLEDDLLGLRSGYAAGDLATMLGGRALAYREVAVPRGGTQIVLGILTRHDHGQPGAAILAIHGGGMVMGTRFHLPPDHLDWVEQHDLVLVTVEYRLAPEHPDPVPVEDCFAALDWMAAHADELGFDRARLVVSGLSAGAGLAASVALLARDRGIALAGQLLICPMLDDRDATVSASQFTDGPWDRSQNAFGWRSLLGERAGGEDVSAYAAPARATDLSGLAPAYLDVGSAEVFRDEVIAYASGIWAAGGAAELHVWPGGFHGFDVAAPLARLSVDARRARHAWLGRTLGH